MAQHTFDVSAFRIMFCEFADATKYPGIALQMHWDNGTNYIHSYDNQLIDGANLQFALNLMTAHLAKSFSMINSGTVPGVINSATEGSVSVSMTPPPTKNMWQWWLATTPYGIQLLALLQSLTVGGFIIGGAPELAAFRRVGGVFYP